MHSVFIDELDAQTYAENVARTGSTIIIPAGATEQHGPHMPLGVDAMLSRSSQKPSRSAQVLWLRRR